MAFDKNGSNPVVIIELSRIGSLGSGDLYFKDNMVDEFEVINSFDNSIALHKFEIDPMVVIGSSSKKVSDLDKSTIGWVVTFSNFPQLSIDFFFSLDIQQSGNSIITPIRIDKNSPGIVKSTHSVLFDGMVVIS
jgi:hypothetical protein